MYRSQTLELLKSETDHVYELSRRCFNLEDFNNVFDYFLLVLIPPTPEYDTVKLFWDYVRNIMPPTPLNNALKLGIFAAWNTPHIAPNEFLFRHGFVELGHCVTEQK
jgi:hypothetical protein